VWYQSRRARQAVEHEVPKPVEKGRKLFVGEVPTRFDKDPGHRLRVPHRPKRTTDRCQGHRRVQASSYAPGHATSLSKRAHAEGLRRDDGPKRAIRHAGRLHANWFAAFLRDAAAVGVSRRRADSCVSRAMVTARFAASCPSISPS
jgi:hypothetical protein